MDNRLLILSVLADQVLIVSAKVNHLDISRNVVKDLVLLKETSLCMAQVIQLYRVKVHLRRCHQQRQILLI